MLNSFDEGQLLRFRVVDIHPFLSDYYIGGSPNHPEYEDPDQVFYPQEYIPSYTGTIFDYLQKVNNTNLTFLSFLYKNSIKVATQPPLV